MKNVANSVDYSIEVYLHARAVFSIAFLSEKSLAMDAWNFIVFNAE